MKKKNADEIPVVEINENFPVDIITYRHILLVNTLNQKVNSGADINQLVKIACDELKKIHHFKGVTIMLRQSETEKDDSIVIIYNNITGSLMKVVENLTGLKSTGLKIPLFETSIFKSIYDAQVSHEAIDKETIIRQFADLVLPEKKLLRKFASEVVQILGINYD